MMLHWGFHFHCASEKRHSEWPWPLFYDTIRSMLSQAPFSRLSNTLRYKLITFITEENEREKISHFTMRYFYNSQALQSWFFPPGMASFQREFITLLHYRKITSPFCTPQSQRNKRKRWHLSEGSMIQYIMGQSSEQGIIVRPRFLDDVSLLDKCNTK